MKRITGIALSCLAALGLVWLESPPSWAQEEEKPAPQEEGAPAPAVSIVDTAIQVESVVSLPTPEEEAIEQDQIVSRIVTALDQSEETLARMETLRRGVTHIRALDLEAAHEVALSFLAEFRTRLDEGAPPPEEGEPGAEPGVEPTEPGAEPTEPGAENGEPALEGTFSANFDLGWAVELCQAANLLKVQDFLEYPDGVPYLEKARAIEPAIEVDFAMAAVVGEPKQTEMLKAVVKEASAGSPLEANLILFFGEERIRLLQEELGAGAG